MGPTAPDGEMVPVAATFVPPVIETLESASITPRAMASPADGPPMYAVLIDTLTGKCQSTASSTTIPRTAVTTGLPGQARSRTRLDGAAVGAVTVTGAE